MFRKFNMNSSIVLQKLPIKPYSEIKMTQNTKRDML